MIIFIIFFFSLIFANPKVENILEKEKKNWIDIVLVLDISYSMNFTDLTPTRLELAKKMLLDFMEKQETNRVWMVIFAWKPFVWIPLTFDYFVLKDNIKNLQTNMIKGLDWTAIWDALILAKNIFSDDDREKVVILFTDWEANQWISPEIASLYLAEENIKIYSVWIWNENSLNDEFLQKISKNTNWKFFRASDNSSFEKIFKDLQKLEKSEVIIEKTLILKEIYDYLAYVLAFLIFLLCLTFFNKKYGNFKF